MITFLDFLFFQWYPLSTMEKNAMHHRIKAVRKALKLNQLEFAKRIGLSQTALSMIEMGHNPATNKNIKLVCVTFNVNEQWLRTGAGEMFCDSPHEREFREIFSGLTLKTQQYLLLMARELLNLQKKLLDKTDA